MSIYRRFFVAFSVLFICSSQPLFAQLSYDWFKGSWMYYGLSPDKIKKEKVESELMIDTVTGNRFIAVQKMRCVSDTLAQMKLNASGYFTNGEIHYKREKEIYRKEPKEGLLWDAYADYQTDTAYFSIRDEKLILHIRVKSLHPDGVKEFAYYRDLVRIPFSLRWQLKKRYGTPQLIDDSVPVVNSNSTPDTASWSEVLPPEIINRKTTLVKTLDVTSPDIQVVFLDDAEIDGDIISLYHNNELVLNHKTIGKEMVKYVLKADAEHAHHEFILIAENLGSIPPNTALVRIRSGETKYEFIVHSDLHENIKFIINYVGDKKIDVVAPKNN